MLSSLGFGEDYSPPDYGAMYDYSITPDISTRDMINTNNGASFNMAPDGSYVSGSTNTLAPDGTYVSGNSAILTPDGSYVGN